MKETLVRRVKEATLKDPILIEGLPGVGHVGKLVAEHLVEELKAEKIIEIYSPHFPPQVMVQEDGTIKQVRNEVYAFHGQNGQPDLLLVVGDYQSATNEGHYELTGIFLDIAQEFGVKRIYALGGYGTGQFVDKPTVLGAANNVALVEEMKQHDVVFHENEPGGGIIGVSGLLLGLGELRSLLDGSNQRIHCGPQVRPGSAEDSVQGPQHRGGHAGSPGKGQGDGEDRGQAPGDGEGSDAL